MEFFFLALLVVLLAASLGSGFPVAFAIPGAAILTVALAALAGMVISGDADAFFLHGGGPWAWLSAGVLNFRGIYHSDSGDTLIGIPLFIFMGLMLQRSKVAEDLLLAMAWLFRAVRGGLGISVILVGALLAATTGIVGATVVTMGMISLPTMLRNDYSKPLASGVIAATGTLGQIIPPSIVLLILVHQLTTAVNQASAARRALYKAATGDIAMPTEFDVFSVSAGDLFMGALLPGLVLVAIYMLYVFGSALLRPALAPAPARDGPDGESAAPGLLVALVPPLLLIVLVLGSIVGGIATVNQAGAIGAAGATVMAGYRLSRGRRGALAPAALVILALIAIALVLHGFDVNLRKVYTPRDEVGIALAALASLGLVLGVAWSGWRTLRIGRTLQAVVDETLKTTALVFSILLGAVMLTAAFRSFGGEDLVRSFLLRLPGGFWGQFSIVMLIVFLLGFFLDFIEITVVVVPIVAPILLADPSANVSAAWLGVMIALVIQTSFLTPPFGFALFYLRGVAPTSVRTIDIYKGVLPFIALQLLALAIVGIFPALVTYLPNRTVLLSHASPPPTSPRLQYCMESFVARTFGQKAAEIGKAIAAAQALDLSHLPDDRRRALAGGFDKARDAMAAMDEIGRRERAVDAAAISYRPLHARVRLLQQDARRLDDEIASLRTLISRAGRTVSEEQAQRARERLGLLVGRRQTLLAGIPPNWDQTRRAFSAVQKAETAARRAYRHNADDAYRPLADMIAQIGAAAELKALAPRLRHIEDQVAGFPSPAVLDAVASLRADLAAIAGSSAIRAGLGDLRRALRAKPVALGAANEAMVRATESLEEEIRWRDHAARTVLPALLTYHDAIADTIGLRGQPRLPEPAALDVAACSAVPRDIFLNF